MTANHPVDHLFIAVANPTRREIMELLADGRERTVSEITGHFGISRQAVTKHLAVLGDAGILACERRGRDRYNRLLPEGIEPLNQWLSRYSEFWDDRLAALKQQVEQEGKT